MNETSLRNIMKASKNVICEKNQYIYIQFMKKRFHPREHYTAQSYANEWAERFNKGPEPYMDKESKRIYNQIINEVNENENV